MDNARLSLAVLIFPAFSENFSVVDDMQSAPVLPPFAEVRAMAERGNPDLRAADALLRAAGEDVRISRTSLLPSLAVDAMYGIEANEFALHSRVAADPSLGVLPNLGYAVTVNLSVPLWDWGGLRSKVHQSETREKQAQVTLQPGAASAREQSVFDIQRSARRSSIGRQPAPGRRARDRKPPSDDTPL